jgi:hypothetical protein
MRTSKLALVPGDSGMASLLEGTTGRVGGTLQEKLSAFNFQPDEWLKAES